MDTLAKADIFFFVTTIAVIIMTVLGCIVAYYLIRVLGNINRASEKLSDEVEAMGEHADSLYHHIKESFLFTLLFGRNSRKERGHLSDNHK